MFGGMVSDATVKAMLRRKPLVVEGDLSKESKGEVGLRRSLNLSDLILYGVGCSVGAGIYCLVGIGAEIAGPGIALSFLCCGVACVFTALAYAEFAARIPITGSAYSYAYIAFGEFWAWLVGWNLTLNYAFSASVVARSWGEYLAAFIRGMPVFQTNGIELEWLTRLALPLPFVSSAYTCSPLSTVIIGLCTLVLVTGAKESSRFNNAMTVLNLSILGFVVFSGFGSNTVDSDNLTPFLSEGLGSVAQGAGLVFFAFIGFDMVACLSEEVKNPEKNMPLGIIGSLVVTTGIYVSVTLVVIGMAPFDLLGGDVPIINALLANGCCTHEQQLAAGASEQCLDQTCSPVVHQILLYGSRIVSFGSIFGLTTGTFTSLMGQPRIFYKMSQDGLLFRVFGEINERTQVPTIGIILTGILCAALAALVELGALANLISLGVLQVFTFVDAGVIILRMRPTIDSHTSVDMINDEESEGDNFPQSAPPNIPVEGFEESLWEVLVAMYRRHTGRSVSENGSKPTVSSVIFTVSIVVLSMAHNNKWNNMVSVLCVISAIASATLLMTLPKSSPPGTFQCPCVPIIPLLGIACNGYMMGSLPVSSWVFSVIWVFLGICIYFFYGIKHSALRCGESETCTEDSPLLSVGSEEEVGYATTAGISLMPIHEHTT